MNTEQWKDSGKCEECRRQAYCTKQCTARKKRAQAAERAIGDQIMRAISPQLADYAEKFRY